MKLLKKGMNALLLLALFSFAVTSCEDKDETDELTGKVVLDKYEVDFGTVIRSAKKGTAQTSEVVLTLINKTNQTVTSLSSSIEFPGQAGVKVVFKPLAPGESIDVPFTFAPGSLEAGEYTGKATLTPSIGDPIEVTLKATVEEGEVSENLIVLDKYEVDFGTVKRTPKKGTPETSEVVLKLTNNSDQTLESLGSSIEFPGSASVKLNFSPLAPGESIEVPFTFAPGSLKAGEYTGKATLTPSIGDPIEVELKAVVAEAEVEGKPVVLDKYEVDFGTVQRSAKKGTPKTSEVVLKLTNKSDQTLESLGSSIEFPGSASVKLNFSPLAPGESIEVPFTFAPGSLKAGEYTGKATLTPSIGDPIEVELKAVVEEAEVEGKPVVLDKYEVDFGTVQRSAKKGTPKTSEVVLKLTNNSNETLTKVGTSVQFPGRASVKLNFRPLAPGESIEVPFTFAPGSLKAGEYTGKATLTPSIGDPIEVELKAVVEEAEVEGKPVVLDKYEVDFGTVQRSAKKGTPKTSKVVLKLTNNSNETLTKVGTSVQFPGRASVKLNFRPLAPGESIEVPFTFAPGSLKAGEYTGKATLTPSIGDPIEVTLKAVVEEAENTQKPVVLSAYEVDFGTVKANSKKNSSETKQVVLTLTNNSNETLTKVGTSVQFPGRAGVKLNFRPLAPGESIDVPFTFAPERLKPGEYTGKATLTPSIGDPIEVVLKATVE